MERRSGSLFVAAAVLRFHHKVHHKPHPFPFPRRRGLLQGEG